MVNYNNSLVSPELFLKLGGWRQPIIMVDRIVDFIPGNKASITVIKHITFNDNYIIGHYPGSPVMPGVMIAEIFGQASEYLSFINDFCNKHKDRTGIELHGFNEISREINRPESEIMLIEHRKKVNGVLASQNLKFTNAVYPGDTIEVKSSVSFSDANKFKHYVVEARVGRHIVCQGTIVNYRESY